MSSRALRRLQEDIIPTPRDNIDDDEEDTFIPLTANRKKNKKKAFAANPFDLLEENSNQEEVTECNNDDACADETLLASKCVEQKQSKNAYLQKKKKKKKPKSSKLIQENNIENNAMIEDEIDASIREVNAILGSVSNDFSECTKQQPFLSANCRSLLNIEHKNLNPDNEMKRIFGSRVIQSEQPVRRTKRGRPATWMTTPKDTWPIYSKTSLTMSVLETAPDDSWQMFTFEHGPAYQRLQLAFYDAVMSVNSENIVALLHDNPYHIDCLLQLSEICKNGEDMQMAKELVERALYSFEMSFHPLFSLTKGNCRLDFRRMENRSFYTALFRHINYLGNKGCHRTALEYCKLLLSLDSELDPLCVLLMIDYYALRSEEFSFLIRLFEEWEPHRNLSQLPNFAFSYPLALYHLETQKEESTNISDKKLQKSLRHFPSVLLPLLDKCSVHPDSVVTASTLFSEAENSLPSGLRQLIGLYVGRCWPCWKEPHVMSWLEKNVHAIIEKTKIETAEDLQFFQRCNMRYRGTPRNISRHILLSEIKEAMTDLPIEVTNSVIMSHDILPPEDNIETYSRPTQRFAMATSVTKKRKYSEEYISYGFTSILADGIEKPQCVLCFKVLGNDSMRPSKLKHHLQTIHPQYAEKDPDFFRRHESSFGKQKLDATGAFQQQTSSVVEASYEVALEIAKQKKPHTIGETLIKPCTLKMVKRVLGDANERKIQQISLSNDTVKRRINEMSDDIKEKVIQEIKSSPAGMFAIQLDESTDVSSCAQLLVFVRYIFLCDIKEEYLLCTQLETTTTAEDVMEKLSSFFKANRIPWENCCGVCTDGAPAMLGSKSGFQKRVKEVAPNAKGVHCMIHRFALASKTLPDELCKILEAVVKCVNFVKAGALNSRLFQNLCRDMDSEHEALLFYSKVRWLSKGNVVNRVFELRGELKLFLEMQGKDDLLSHFNEVLWEPRLAYLADIFEQLNRLNLKLQGKERNVFHLMDCLRGFLAKLQNWQRKVGAGNVAMFENLSAVLDENEEDSLLDPLLKTEITQHLRSLESELNMYFPEFEEEEGKLVRNPFSGTLDITTIPSDVQDEFLDLKHDSAAKDLYEEKSLNVFWCSMHQSYPKVSEIALRLLLPFSTTYLCESGFSTLLQIKNKSRNRLDVDPDMRCALSVTQPRIRQLTEKKQYQPSH